MLVFDVEATFSLTLYQALLLKLEVAWLEVPGFTSVACAAGAAIDADQPSAKGLVNDSVMASDWPLSVLSSSVTPWAKRPSARERASAEAVLPTELTAPVQVTPVDPPTGVAPPMQPL